MATGRYRNAARCTGWCAGANSAAFVGESADFNATSVTLMPAITQLKDEGMMLSRRRLLQQIGAAVGPVFSSPISVALGATSITGAAVNFDISSRAADQTVSR